jgi:hypothetical protein
MANNLLYDPTIRDAIASADLTKMKTLLTQAKQQMRQHASLVVATLDLEEAIHKLEQKKSK